MQVGVGLDAVDRGEPQPFEAGRGAQDGLDEAAQLQFAAEIRAIGGEIDAGQDDLAKAPIGEAADGAKGSLPAPTERDGPRPKGMMQKVQRWSQPVCTARKARVWSSTPSLRRRIARSKSARRRRCG